MIYRSFFVLLLLLLWACQSPAPPTIAEIQPSEKVVVPQPMIAATRLDRVEARRLAALPLACLDTEYPNKLSQVLSGAEDLRSPSALHPTFYGRFDWHSAVHGHWSSVQLLHQFPDLEEATIIEQKLRERITPEHIQSEIIYFQTPHNKNFERTYGWAWLLKLAEALYTLKTPLGQELSQNLQPLTDLIVQNYLDFLPKLQYPIRVGTHTNTAFGLGFAYDYAQTVGHTKLKAAIEQRVLAFYAQDQACPIGWEPGGYDFLSPCLEEADMMRRVLSKEAFATWLDQFLPQLSNTNFWMKPAIVRDREDGHLVHLDGVNFCRAWCLYGIAQTLPEYGHLLPLAHAHVQQSLPNIVDDHYEGGHWLGSFALYALSQVPE